MTHRGVDKPNQTSSHQVCATVIRAVISENVDAVKTGRLEFVWCGFCLPSPLSVGISQFGKSKHGEESNNKGKGDWREEEESIQANIYNRVCSK